MDLEKLESYVNDGIVFKEEKDGYDVYVCGYDGLCKIIVYPDGSYDCNFDDVYNYLDSLSDDIKDNNASEINGQELGIPVLVDDKTGLRYFNDKDIMNIIKNKAKSLLKKLMNKDSFIRAHLYQELVKMGYEDNFRLTNFSVKNSDTLNDTIDMVSEEIYTRYSKYSFGYHFDGDTIVYSDNNQDYEEEDIDVIVGIVENVFGVNSLEHNELLGHFISFDDKNEGNFKKLFLNSDYANVVRDMFEYAMIQYEKQYSKYIANNVRINFTLRQAYNAFSDELKTQLAEEIFYGDSLETKLISDIVSILSMKCSKRDNKKYDREEIVRFLVDNSASKVSSLMPDDFDVFRDLGQADNNALVNKYQQMAMQTMVEEDSTGTRRKN